MKTYIKFTNGARVCAENIGTININGSQLFVHDHQNSLLVAPKFKNAEDAEMELLQVNEQMDAWIAAQQEREQAVRVPRNGRR